MKCNGRCDVAGDSLAGSVRRPRLVISAASAFAFTVTALAAAAQTPLSAPRVRAVAEMRIDGAKEDLTSTGFVSVGPDGRVVLSQMQDVQLRFYDSTGRRLASFGRRGQGPGEYNTVAVWPGWVGDTLWTFERSQNRLTLISPQIGLLRTIANPMHIGRAAQSRGGRELRFFQPLALYSDGSMLGSVLFTTRDSAGAEIPDSSYVRVSPSGDLLKEIGVRPPSDGRIRLPIPGGRPPHITGLVPYFPHPLADISDDGSRLAFFTTTFETGGRGATFLVVLGSNGDTLVTRRYTFAATPIPDSVRERSIRMAMSQFNGSSIRGGRGVSIYPAQSISAYEKQLRAIFPRFYPPVGEAFSGLSLGRDNTVWLKLHPTIEGDPYLMLDDKGAPVATVVLPARTAYIAAATRNTIWAVENDDDGLPSVVRYRLEGLRQ